MASFYTIFQHKPIAARITSFLSDREVFRMFAVSSRLRNMWYIQYERLKNGYSFEARARQVQAAREWRKALDIQNRLFSLKGVWVDISKRDPMKKMRTLVRQDLAADAAGKRRPTKRIKV
jgi:hypothetical protein